jgi:arginyl-tRNA synthetase
MIVDIKNEIILTLRDMLGEYTKEKIKFLLEKPENEDFGDYSSNVALVAAKILKKNPLELANELTEQLNKILPRPNAGGQARLGNIEKVEAVKPGFINFWVSKNYLFSQLEKILNEKEKFGSKNEDLNKKIIVEYSSPNIAKPFTVGHLRSTIIGDAIANLLAANGWKVYRDNHLGDWGTQFGKQIYAIKTWGDEKKIEQAENPVKELVALYVKFHEEAEKSPELEERAREWFKKLEEGDTEARRLWRKCVDWSLKEFEKIYQELGIEFTENEGMGYSESFFEDKIQPVMKELREKKLTKESEDAELVFFPADRFPPLMILKKDGTTLYSTRDLATDKFRLERYGKDIQIINEVGNEQALYFRQLFELEKILGWVKDGQRIHKKHGLYRFKDQKMSTRKGNTIWLEDVLKEAKKRALSLSSEKDIEIAKKVAIGAIKWNDLKRTSEQDIVFDWDEVLNMQGDSGPYLQYAFARTQSVLNKCHPELVSGSSPEGDSLRQSEMLKLVQHDKIGEEEISLLRALNKFPEVIEAAGEKFAPNILCNYLFDLGQKFNLFYQKCKIVGSKEEKLRLELTRAVGQVIKNGLNLLGISAPEKM